MSRRFLSFGLLTGLALLGFSLAMDSTHALRYDAGVDCPWGGGGTVVCRLPNIWIPLPEPPLTCTIEGSWAQCYTN